MNLIQHGLCKKTVEMLFGFGTGKAGFGTDEEGVRHR